MEQAQVRPVRSLRRSRTRTRQLQQSLLFYAGLCCVECNALLETMGVSITLPIDYTRPAFLLGTVICFLLMNDR